MPSWPLAGALAVFVAGAALLPAGRACAAPAPTATQQAMDEQAAFYHEMREKQYDAAVAAGARYRQARPDDDRFALDYAYALIDAHRTADATALLEHLTTSRDATVRAAAQRQLIAMTPPPPPPPSPFAHAYELFAGGDLAASKAAFETALVEHPDDAAAWHQLAFIDLALNDRPGTIAALRRYVALEPADENAKLELAYQLLLQGDRAEGNALLNELTRSSDATVAAAARKQLATEGGGAPPRFDAFGYAVNESRFHDTFFGLDTQYALTPTRIQPYVALHIGDDARAPSVPPTSILNDDVIILSAGVRAPIAPFAFVFVQAGEAQSLRTGQFETDLRYGALLSTRLGAGGFKPQTEIDASAIFYSRYVDTIAYVQVAHDFYIGSKIVRGVVGVNLALDTNRLYYNNAIEGFAGVQVRSGAFLFRLAGVAGYYLPRGIDPPERTYSSFNPLVTVGIAR